MRGHVESRNFWVQASIAFANHASQGNPLGWDAQGSDPQSTEEATSSSSQLGTTLCLPRGRENGIYLPGDLGRQEGSHSSPPLHTLWGMVSSLALASQLNWKCDSGAHQRTAGNWHLGPAAGRINWCLPCVDSTPNVYQHSQSPPVIKARGWLGTHGVSALPQFWRFYGPYAINYRNAS